VPASAHAPPLDDQRAGGAKPSVSQLTPTGTNWHQLAPGGGDDGKKRRGWTADCMFSAEIPLCHDFLPRNIEDRQVRRGKRGGGGVGWAGLMCVGARR
jgi:hypothetical protein